MEMCSSGTWANFVAPTDKSCILIYTLFESVVVFLDKQLKFFAECLLIVPKDPDVVLEAPGFATFDVDAFGNFFCFVWVTFFIVARSLMRLVFIFRISGSFGARVFRSAAILI